MKLLKLLVAPVLTIGISSLGLAQQAPSNTGNSSQKADDAFRSGNALMGENRYCDALGRYKEGLAAVPDDTSLLYNGGLAAFLCNEYATTVKYWTHLKSIDSDDWGAQGRACAVRIAFLRCHLSLDADGKARPCVGDDDEPLRHALGVFLLLASRSPSAHRSLIVFTAWSSLAHASVMGVLAFLGFIARRELFGVAAFVVIGVALIALAPAKRPVERPSAVVM